MNSQHTMAHHDLGEELALLAAWADAKPKARDLRAMWGELPSDLRSEWAEGMRLGPAPQAPRMNGAGRASAAVLMAASSLPWATEAAQAAPISASSYMIAATPVVRVVNAATGAGVAGVAVKSMDEKVFGVTDGEGQITLPAEAMTNEGVIALEKDGFAVQIVDVTQLSGRNVVSLRPAGSQVASAAGGADPVVPPPVPPAPAMPAPPRTPAAPAAPAARPTPRAVVAQSHAAPAHAAPAAAATAKPVVRLPGRPVLAARPAAATPTPKPVAAPATPDPALAAARAATLALPSRPRLAAAAEAASPVPPSQATPAPNAEPPTLPNPAGLAGAPRHVVAGGSHLVRPGDSLSLLARRHLGSARRWPELFALNRDRVANPAIIRVGQVLRLPSHAGAMPHHVAQRVATRLYVVKPGDTLEKIAIAQYGNGGRWGSIWRANARYVRDPGRIFAGQRLRLPLR